MTPEGTTTILILLAIVIARLGFGRLFVNREDDRKLHHTVKGYLLTTLGALFVFGTIFGLRFVDLSTDAVRLLLLGVLFLFGCYYAFLEWRYIRGSRRHIATLLTTAVAVLVVGGYLFFLPLA